MTTRSLFINLIKSSVLGEAIENIDRSDIDYQSLFTLAKNHDLGHVVYDGLEKNALLPQDAALAKTFKKQKLLALYRIIQFDDEIKKLKLIFTELGVRFVLLKGSVLRAYYPERWMRTGCDVDVLVEKADFFKVSRHLTKKLGYKNVVYQSHDASMFSPSGVHLELHYALLEENVIPSTKKLFKSVWEYATPYSGNEYCLKAEFFYTYHIAHMAKHLKNGGCGVRPFIDLWVLKTVMNVNAKSCADLLNSCDLYELAVNSERLADYWFDNGEGDELTLRFEAFVLSGGVYGNMQNRAAIGSATKQKRTLISYIWKPYEELKYWYPSLENHKLLLPFYEVARWFKIIFGGTLKNNIERKRVTAAMDEQSLKVAADFVKRIGLK